MLNMSSRVVDVVEHNSASFMVETHLYNGYLLRVLCAIIPETAKRVHASRDSFANGILSTVFNRRLDDNVLKYATHKFGILFEMGYMHKAVEHMVDALLAKAGRR